MLPRDLFGRDFTKESNFNSLNVQIISKWWTFYNLVGVNINVSEKLKNLHKNEISVSSCFIHTCENNIKADLMLKRIVTCVWATNLSNYLIFQEPFFPSRSGGALKVNAWKIVFFIFLAYMLGKQKAFTHAFIDPITKMIQQEFYTHAPAYQSEECFRW